jgi:hypothetical protein
MPSKLNQNAWFLMVTGAVLLGIGVYLSFYLAEKWDKVAQLAKELRRVRLEDLLTEGPGENAHVIVTDFVEGPEYVYEQTGTTRREMWWDKVWIPLFTPDNAGPDLGEAGPRQIRVLLVMDHPSGGKTDVAILLRRGWVQGVAREVRGGGALDPQVRSKLQESYPNAELSDYLLIEEEGGLTKERAGVEAYLFSGLSGGGAGLGVVVLIVGLFLWNLDRRRSRSNGAESEQPDTGR